MEYRTKLINPKWAEANQGSGGAFEISPTNDCADWLGVQ